ncbi:MAG: DUF domain-containing protein [Candidatus Acidiferrales bacterium]
MKTAVHKKIAADQAGPMQQQQLLSECLNTTSTLNAFNKDLCQMMIRCNIPLHNLEVNDFKIFLEKYTGQTVLSRRTVCRSYLPEVYEDCMDRIKAALRNKYIWFSVDETTDSLGRYIANFVVGVLDGKPSACYLVGVKQLDRTNSVTISRFVNDCLSALYLPEAVPSDKILFMVTDAAKYMIKAGEHLKIFYPNLSHLTCLAHGINRVAETIRTEYPLVNKLINNGKKIFLKAPTRVQVYKDYLPNVPLPPQPILTRWGTWIEAALFYADNFQGFKNVVESFDVDTSTSITDCQQILKNKNIITQLSQIKVYFFQIPDIIKKLEARNLKLSESLMLIDRLETKLKENSSEIGKKVLLKFVDVIKKNASIEILKNVDCALSGGNIEEAAFFPKNILTPDIIPNLLYCPVTSCDVERSFSRYGNILADNRHNFLIENLEKHLIVNYNRDE